MSPDSRKAYSHEEAQVGILRGLRTPNGSCYPALTCAHFTLWGTCVGEWVFAKTNLPSVRPLHTSTLQCFLCCLVVVVSLYFNNQVLYCHCMGFKRERENSPWRFVYQKICLRVRTVPSILRRGDPVAEHTSNYVDTRRHKVIFLSHVYPFLLKTGSQPCPKGIVLTLQKKCMLAV